MPAVQTPQLLPLGRIRVGERWVVRRVENEDPPASTIAVPEMDCAGCAKRLGQALVQVPGVAKAEYDVTARTIKLTHKAGDTPSPKELWEAVEKGHKEPKKLESPGVTYTKKPAS